MRIIVLAVALVVFCISCAAPEESAVEPAHMVTGTEIDKEKMTRTDAQLIVVPALIEAVDVEERLLTVKDSEGTVETIRVDPAVERLNEVKKGDTITLRYYQSVAFEVREPTAEEKANPGMLFGAAGRRDAKSEPGGGAIVMAHAITTIDKIDTESAMVTLKGPKGHKAKVKAKDPKNLEKLNVGDTVAVTLTEAIAVGIEPRK